MADSSAHHEPRASAFLAFATADLGDFARTEALIEYATTKDDPWATAVALAVRCKLGHVRGDLDGMQRDGTRSAALFRELGDRWGLLLADEWLGALAELRGEYDEAARLQLDGLRLAEDLELWPDVAGRLAWLGFIAWQRLGYVEELQGNVSAARAHHREAIRLANKLASPRDLAWGYAALAAVSDPSEGARLLGAAAAVRVTAHMPCSPAEQSDVDRVTAAMRTALGDAAFDADFAIGFADGGP